MNIIRLLNIVCALWWLWLAIDVMAGHPLDTLGSVLACFMVALSYVRFAIDSD